MPGAAAAYLAAGAGEPERKLLLVLRRPTLAHSSLTRSCSLWFSSTRSSISAVSMLLAEAWADAWGGEKRVERAGA